MNCSVQKSLEKDAKIVSNNLLNLFAQKLTRKEYLDSAIEVIAEWTGFRCIGIRILDSQGYISYASHKGFSSQFLEKENRLSINADECACIRVINGELNFDGYQYAANERSGSNPDHPFGVSRHPYHRPVNVY